MGSDSIAGLLHFLDSSPTPFHAVENAASLLTASGFFEQTNLTESLHRDGYIKQDGAIVAWRLGAPSSPLRIVGAHTDSPNLRIQPHPDMFRLGWAQLGVEIYGGVLLNSWLDRDLGIAGRVIDSAGESHLFMVNEPIARVPQLAIHLDREIGERGLLLDKFQHTSPVWGLSQQNFGEWLTGATGIADISAFDAHLFDVQPSTLLGSDKSMIASARLDNQLSCWAAITSLTDTSQSEFTQIMVLNDHEEVGSSSVTGAAGQLLTQLIAIINEEQHVTASGALQRMNSSWCLSADNAHAVHPNYQERHDPRHSPIPNAGPALKLNGNQRYATSARGAAHLHHIAKTTSTPIQTFVSRNNMPCGSTIGPITATLLGIEAIDIGVPQLSMHSIREVCGAQDPIYLATLMSGFFQN